MTNTVILGEEDITVLTNAIIDVAKTNLKGRSKQQLQFPYKLTKHVNKLSEAINEVKSTIEAETYGVILVIH